MTSTCLPGKVCPSRCVPRLVCQPCRSLTARSASQSSVSTSQIGRPHPCCCLIRPKSGASNPRGPNLEFAGTPSSGVSDTIHIARFAGRSVNNSTSQRSAVLRMYHSVDGRGRPTLSSRHSYVFPVAGAACSCLLCRSSGLLGFVSRLPPLAGNVVRSCPVFRFSFSSRSAFFLFFFFSHREQHDSIVLTCRLSFLFFPCFVDWQKLSRETPRSGRSARGNSLL